MGYIKVKGHDGLVRDETSGAIVNHSDSAIQARRKQRQLNSALDDINILKDEVSEIKSLLRELIKNARN
jgi:tRNA uridine 5-carbamoylmethylation protein Kti12